MITDYDLPDHATPVSIRTHCADPVPFLIYDSRKTTVINEDVTYTENSCRNTGTFIEEGHKLMDMFLQV